MDHVLTLVTAGPIGDGPIAAARAALADAGATVAATDRLGPEACDVAFDGIERERARPAVEAALAGQPVDAFVLAANGRRKRMLVADMESTVIENELLDDIAEMTGIGPEIARITAAAMGGKLDFAEALRRRVALLAGADAGLLDRAAAGIRPMAGAATLVATMTSAGAASALISGGFTVFVDRVGARLGFGSCVANVLAVADGRLTGAVERLEVTPDGKSEALLALCRRHGVRPAETLAIGDGANDIPMLAIAGLAVGVRPKPIVAARLHHRIVHADLRAALYVQGYRRADFVEAG